MTSTPTKPVNNVVITTKGLQDRNINILDGTTVENKGKLIQTSFHSSNIFNHPHFIRRNIQAMKFVIVKISNIRLSHVFKYRNPDSSLYVRDHVSQAYSTTGNIIVLYILIFKQIDIGNEDTELPDEICANLFSLRISFSPLSLG